MDTVLDAVPILRYLLLLLYVLVLYYVAVTLEERVMAYFDTRWLPKSERRFRKVPAGVRLLLVTDQYKPAVVLWSVLKAEAILFGIGLGVGILLAGAYLVGWYLNYWRSDGNIASASLALFVFRFIAPMFVLQLFAVLNYWLAEWSRRRTRLVVFSDLTYIIVVRPTFIGFFLGSSPDLVIIPERTAGLRRALTASDIQRIDPSFKTPWLRDQFTFLMAGRSGLGSTILPSEQFGDIDAFVWVEEVRQKVSCLHQAAKIAAEEEKSEDRAGFFGDMEMYRVYQDTESPEQAEDAREQIMDAREMFDERKSPEGKIDLFNEKDPGICKSGELLIEKEELPAGTISIAPRYKPTPQTSESPNPVERQDVSRDEGDDDDDNLPPSRLHRR